MKSHFGTPAFSFRTSALAMLSFSAALALHAESIFVEDFEKASGEEGVSMVEGAGSWHSRGNRLFLGAVEDSDGLKSGKVLRVTKGLVYVSFPEVDLAEGDSLEVTFRFRFALAPEENGFPLRIGLAWDDSGNPDGGNAPGYWLMTSPGVENGNAMLLLEEGTDGSMGGGSDIPILPPMFQAPASGTAVTKVAFTVSRPSDGVVDVTSQINEDSPVTRSDTNAKVTKFNVFAISLATMGETDFMVDDVKVTVNRKAK